MLRHLATALMAASAANAISHSSPFFALSNEPLKSPSFHSTQVATALDVETNFLASIASCATDYFLFLDREIAPADFHSMPKLLKRIAAWSNDTLVEIPIVSGEVDTSAVIERIGKMCRVTDAGDSARWSEMRKATVTPPKMEVGRDGNRGDVVRLTDQWLEDSLEKIVSMDRSYVVVYTTPSGQRREPPPYEMDDEHPGLPHTDLRRDIPGARKEKDTGSDHAQDGLPLFEKYMFLTPGIFMTLSVSLLLFLILYVGVSAIAGLEVSYMAFSKEMGPNAQKPKGS